MMKEILRVLEQDGQTTPQAIATMLGKPVSEVKKAIKEAETTKAIVKYKAVVNWDKVGNEQVWALIEVRLTPQRGVGFDALAERIYRFPEARFVYLLSGTYDLAVIIVGSSMHEVAAFVSGKLAPLEGVQGTVTHFLLKRYKEDGVILEGSEELKRLPIAP